MTPPIQLLFSPRWTDYELLDSGNGQKLERFGPFRFNRPEVQALWSPALPVEAWNSAQAEFIPAGAESGGHWRTRTHIDPSWRMSYPLTLSATASAGQGGALRFSAGMNAGRNLGVFPECAANWEWMAEILHAAEHPPRVLNLFGYTGLASLVAAACGARVTHVDASRRSVNWARENQSLSGLDERPIRWLVDDALKFLQREARRGGQYDGILLDPPKFGRGPQGQVWEIYPGLPGLLQACRNVLGNDPLFVILTVYAVKLPAVHAYAALQEAVKDLGGFLECGELATQERSAGRTLSQAVFARWRSG
jgi:23S rRNA (cytosine1962-C5)-methyltransferase